MRKNVFGLVLLVGLAAGCGGAGERDAYEARRVSARLMPLASCQDVESALRGSALRAMNEALDAALEDYLAHGGQCWDEDGYAAGTSGAGGGAATPNTGSEEASEVSGTNNQVAGVDEADFVKNDNKYIYVVSNGALRILEAWPAPQAHEIAKVALEGTPRRLFVSADRLMVYASMGSGSEDYYGGGSCTYGYDCEFTGDGMATRVSVFDISDRSAPVLERQLDLSGSFINARRIGNAVHTVVHDEGVSFPGLSYFPADLPYCDEEVPELLVRASFEKLRMENARIILRTPLTDWLPSVVDTDWSGGAQDTRANILGDCTGFYDSPLGDGSGFITLISIDMAQDATLATSSIVSRPGAAYASSDALYVSVRQSLGDGNGWYDGMDGQTQVSTVHKFALASDPPSATYAASGVIKGSVLNQFAMDEHDGNLRVATTTGHVPDPNVHSTLSVLSQVGTELTTIGKLDRLAPTEDIRSVRFAGDKGFMVTFKKTDPLFVIDLSRPTDPAVLAELKIPGFSTYMHMMDDTHLLTIGYDADDQGSFAWFTGVMLQIFDVTVPTDPKLTHKEVIGTRGSSSEALTNHLAFTYFAPKEVLCLPITVCEGGNGGSYGTDMTFSGLMVFDTTVAGGFHLRGKVAHPTSSSGGYDDAGCSNWWTHASTEVKRSIVMDDYVFSVSESRIKINHLDALATDLVELPLVD